MSGIPDNWYEEHDGQRLVLRTDKVKALRQAILDYLSECDNPVPDAMFRRTLRNNLRKIAEAPPEPAQRRF
jgi:plasmid stabilization system protein ParE